MQERGRTRIRMPAAAFAESRGAAFPGDELRTLLESDLCCGECDSPRVGEIVSVRRCAVERADERVEHVDQRLVSRLGAAELPHALVLYGSSLNEWREALLGVSGTSTQFSNAFTRRRGLEPQGIVREVTSVRKRRDTITHLCNDGASWSPVAVKDAIDQIQAGVATYVTRRREYGALIKVVSDGHGGYYLRSQSDQASADNLDNLPLSTR